MPRLARYLGRWIYHSGWYPDRKVRLYDRRKAKWIGEFVHESVKPLGRWDTWRATSCTLRAIRCRSIAHAGRYTTLAAQELAANRVRVPLWSLILDPPWTL